MRINSTFEDGETVFQFVGTTSIVGGDITLSNVVSNVVGSKKRGNIYSPFFIP